jgi:hypothetical protein
MSWSCNLGGKMAEIFRWFKKIADFLAQVQSFLWLVGAVIGIFLVVVGVQQLPMPATCSINESIVLKALNDHLVNKSTTCLKVSADLKTNFQVAELLGVCPWAIKEFDQVTLNNQINKGLIRVLLQAKMKNCDGNVIHGEFFGEIIVTDGNLVVLPDPKI